MAKSVWKSILGSLIGEGRGIVKEVTRTIRDTEKKIEMATAKAIKAASVFLLMFIGLIFALVGVSQWLAVKYSLQAGMGYVIVGVLLFLLGWFGKAVRN